ncbi:MAG: shikimate kinase [Flavobacterium sp.]
MKKIVLTGYMASGKTTIALLLSKASGLEYADLDEVIEAKAGKTIASIFSESGEIYFRKYEHEALKEMLEKDKGFVLALGGGTPCYANNHLLLQNEGVISVYLKASVQELASRLRDQGHKRPLLQNVADAELEEFIAKHLFDRAYYYNHAKHVVSVDGKSPEAIVNEIMSLF